MNDVGIKGKQDYLSILVKLDGSVSANLLTRMPNIPILIIAQLSIAMLVTTTLAMTTAV